MKNVFIAIGGSGTKVAEALVKLLTVGFPTKNDEAGILTSTGDSLAIWRVYPDRNSGAAEDLKLALDNYRMLQGCLGDGDLNRKNATSRWAMDISTEVIHLDPLDLPKKEATDNREKTLKGILDSRYGNKKHSTDFLNAFFLEKELNVPIDRGFYQRPFIGSAVMAIFADSLKEENSPAGDKARLPSYENTPTNFFLCGSLHGGTGACGVPVIAQFLGQRKKPEWGWRIGGCLLAPYFVPPKPPFEKLEENEEIDEFKLKEIVKAHANHQAFANLTPEQKETLVRQILEGFYADPEEMLLRARHGLDYYRQDEGSKYFDELYLVSKSTPNKLVNWSNGGASQRNPLNSSEVVAAVSALNFFAQTGAGDKETYVIASADREVEADKMFLYDLPAYALNQINSIDPEKVFLAASLLNHLVLHQIPWEKMSGGKGEMEFCKKYDGKTAAQINTDLAYYKKALSIIGESIQSLLMPHSDMQPSGWHPEIRGEIMNYFSTDSSAIDDVKSRLEKISKLRFWAEDKGPNRLGNSTAKITSFDFAEWCPPGNFTRGEYLRFVWDQVFQKCQQKLN